MANAIPFRGIRFSLFNSTSTLRSLASRNTKMERMTKEEAIKELAELEPKEAAAWARVEKANAERLKVESEWMPMFTRKQKLKTFLEMA